MFELLWSFFVCVFLCVLGTKQGCQSWSFFIWHSRFGFNKKEQSKTLYNLAIILDTFEKVVILAASKVELRGAVNISKKKSEPSVL